MHSLGTIGVIINTASGGSSEATHEEASTILRSAGVHDAKLWSVDGAGLEAAFVEASSCDTLIVIGGDGTIRSAAQHATFDGPALIPLPGGTMNLLPKALYGDLSWQETLAVTLRNPKKRVLSGGKIGEDRFFITALIGAPALWAKAREALREGAIDVALEKGAQAVDRMFASKVSYEFNALHMGSAEAITVTCPLISEVLSDDRKVFEAAVIDISHAGDMLGLATAAAFGQWRDDQNVAVVATERVKITADTRIPIILDGEPIERDLAFEVEFIPKAFTAIVPA